MTADAHTADDAEIEQIARDLSEIEGELRDVHGAPVCETKSIIIFADEHGHELNEIAELEDVDRGGLSEWMHETARSNYDGDGPGDAWSVADPIVVLKN